MQQAILILIAGLASSAAALPSSNSTGNQLGVAGYGYATFYSDYNCKENPSVAFSMGNDACLENETGRHSIYIQPGDNGDFGAKVSLVFSPGPKCGCQDHCQAIAYNGGVDYCLQLEGTPSATSFRFIGQGCGGNNCPS